MSRIYPFFLGCPICWHIIVYSSLHNLSYFCCISCNFFFILFEPLPLSVSLSFIIYSIFFTLFITFVLITFQPLSASNVNARCAKTSFVLFTLSSYWHIWDSLLMFLKELYLFGHLIIFLAMVLCKAFPH